MSGIGQQLETQIDQHNGVSDHVFTQIQQLLHVIVLNEGDVHVLMPLPHVSKQALHGVENLGQTDGAVFVNTNLAAAVATCVTMIFTWKRYGKPDVSMTCLLYTSRCV